MVSKEPSQPDPVPPPGPSDPHPPPSPDSPQPSGPPRQTPAPKPASYDGLLKALLQRYSIELAAWLLGERPEEVVELNTAHAEVQTRFSDKFYRLRFARRAGVLMHVEFQMAGDFEMPTRMVGYTGPLAKTLHLAAEEGLRPASIVVYLHKESYRDDPGEFYLEGEFDFKLHVRYKVIKLWEHRPEPILEMESPGLTPLVPLMAGNADELLVKSVEKIRNTPESVASPEMKRELLTVLGTLASKVIKNKEFLRKVRSEVWIMGDNWFLDEVRDEGLQVGLVKGREEGREEATRSTSLEILWSLITQRFGEVPKNLRERIERETTAEDLRGFILLAARCPDLEAFRLGVEK